MSPLLPWGILPPPCPFIASLSIRLTTMKSPRSASLKKDNPLQKGLRRLLSRIPGRWRAAVMLAAFTVLFPVWITSIIWDAVNEDTTPASQESGAA